MTLFDMAPVVVDPPEKLSADQRRTRRARIAIANGKHPANGLPIDTAHRCGDCTHLVRVHGAQHAWLKCPNHRLGKSHSAASDMRASWPACPRFEATP